MEDQVPVRRLADIERVIEIDKPRSILKAARKLDLAEGECVSRNLLHIDREEAAGRFAFDVKTVNAWATGDIELQRAQSANTVRREDCVLASINAVAKDPDAGLPPDMSRGIDIIVRQQELHDLATKESRRNWIAAAERALAKNAVTFTVLPMHLVLESSGWVAELERKGYIVEPPR